MKRIKLILSAALLFWSFLLATANSSRQFTRRVDGSESRVRAMITAMCDFGPKKLPSTFIVRSRIDGKNIIVSVLKADPRRTPISTTTYSKSIGAVDLSKQKLTIGAYAASALRRTATGFLDDRDERLNSIIFRVKPAMIEALHDVTIESETDIWKFVVSLPVDDKLKPSTPVFGI